jgi:hypothetical protein
MKFILGIIGFEERKSRKKELQKREILKKQQLSKAKNP